MSGLTLPPNLPVAQFEFLVEGNPHHGRYDEVPRRTILFVVLPPVCADELPWAAGTVWDPGERVYQVMKDDGKPGHRYVCLHMGRLIE